MFNPSKSKRVESHVNSPTFSTFTVVKRSRDEESFSLSKVYGILRHALHGLEGQISIDLIIDELRKNIYTGIATKEIERALVLSVLPFIENDPAYDTVAKRLLLYSLYKDVLQVSSDESNRDQLYRATFTHYLETALAHGHLDKKLLEEFDLEKIMAHLAPERDESFKYMGLQTIYEKYLLQVAGRRIEAPQYFWMRVAMGLALGEKENRTERACQFYDIMSTFRYVPGTPTLLHAGTTRPQLSSCYLTTVDDDLEHIFKCLGDNAQMSKYSGGVANDWTNIRSIGSRIKSIDVSSQGLVPFLKLVNDVTAVINRSGKRRGATCVYLESWHLDIEDFLDLRRNTGDERRRAHDINTANWIPDLFMKRIERDGDWTLFSPDDVPDLHHLYGREFEERYAYYEKLAQDGGIENFKVIKAKQLWKKMLMRLFETGHPWVTFKDAGNIRSPQDHAGVIHSTNLCTEIFLNTSNDETAVCNLGSVNLAQHMSDGVLDEKKLAQTIETAMRMLDNVIDINFYPTKEGQNANMRHRPVGLGVMGLQDALFMSDIGFADERARDFCDATMETISYYAIYYSSLLARERGAYPSFEGSKWDRDMFPIDTLDLLAQVRGEKVLVNRTQRRDWSVVRNHVRRFGMRNSNTMAIAPTATIANISGCMPCIEPQYKNLYVKANQQGEFIVVNQFLVRDLKELGLWTREMREQIKFYDGSIQAIQEIPADLRNKYRTAFEIDPEWLVELTAVRGKWIDQSQSHNVFMDGVSGKKLNDIYFKAWRYGLKSTYYLRTLGASQIEKSTLDAKKYGFTQKRAKNPEAPVAEAKVESAVPKTTPMDDMLKGIKACSIENPDCESCQ